MKKSGGKFSLAKNKRRLTKSVDPKLSMKSNEVNIKVEGNESKILCERGNSDEQKTLPDGQT